MDAGPRVIANAELAFHAGARRDEPARFSSRTMLSVLAGAACYYLATRAAWALRFPDSNVSLFFPPHAVLVCILLLVPTRQWWAYALAAACSHFFATQQEHWPLVYALQCEAFDVVKVVLTAAGIRAFVKSPFDRIGLREAVAFVLIAVLVVPVGTAFWGAAFTVAYHYGTHYWVEWRNLGISNGVTAIVLVPVIMIAAERVTTKRRTPRTARILEAGLLAAAISAIGFLAFDREPAGPDTSPALLYAPVPVLIWAALRFGLGGMSASMLFVTVVAIWGTMQGRGPFLTQTPTQNALALQLFLLMIATPLLLLAVAIDDERRSKKALRVNEARMNLAVESAQLALWDWDMANDRMWTTDEGRKFFGIHSGEAVDHATLGGRVHPDDRAARSAAIHDALTTGGSYEAEFRIVLPDGSVRWIAARGRSPSPAVHGRPARVLGVSIDITQQKQVAAELQLQREKLAHLARVSTLSALSGSLAHELSQPLASILSNAQAAQRFMGQEPPALIELPAILTDIVSADRRAAEIIGRLRAMMRRGEVVLQPVNANESVEELLRIIRSDLIARDVSVAKVVAGDLPAVMTDRVQLQQILLNLIVNACDAMASIPAPQRILTLTTCIVQDEMRIGVLDCGIGLPDDIETLFEPFHTTKDGGLGMGLWLCRTLAASHGGRLWAERRPEGGAAFYLALTVARRAA